MLELFNQYQTEIIAALALLVVLILYVIIKSKQKKPQIIEDPYDTPDLPQQEDIQPSKQEVQSTQQEAQIEATPLQEEQQSTQKESKEAQEVQSTPAHTPTPHADVQKREVPPHGKINKEDFKEFANIRILLAEDNLINQKVILGLLADSGIEIVVANDGQEALDILEKDANFMLVLMDAHMPNIDGFEATQKIRATSQYNHIPVIALSGDTAADDIKKMLDAGMEAHLEKPLKMDALYDVLYTYYVPQTQPTLPSQNEDEIVVLNIDEGLEICGGDKEFYADILKEFVRDYRDSSQKLQTYINEKRLQEVDKLLLDIVGISANIGAKELHKSATELKTSLSSASQIKEKFLAYHESLKNLLTEIQNYFKK